MLPDHGLSVVDVRPNDRAHARLTNAGGSGWLVCPLAPRPQGKGDRLQAVCDALLAAMGKSNQLGGSQRNTREQLREVVAWLIAEDVSQLLILDGHYVGGGSWNTLIDVAVETGAGLVIACDANELRRGHKDLLPAYAIPWCTTEHLFTQMPAAPAKHEADGGWPPLPESHFTTFAAEMRDLLAPDRRRQAENEYREAAARTHAWLAERPVVEGEELARFLLDLVAGVPWTEQTVLRLKAAQTALFVAGWVVEVNFDRFLADTEGTVRLTPETTARLRRYSRAAPPAAAVLSMLTRRSSEALAAVKLSDLAADGSTVAVDAGAYEVTAHARSILRAQMWQRLLEGAAEDAPLFHERRSSSADDGARGNRVQRHLGTVTNRGGVRVTREWSERKVRRSSDTLHRIGVVIRPISPTGGMPWLRRG